MAPEPPQPPSLQGQVVAITGAASGIGAAALDFFADRGATVVGLDVVPPTDADVRPADRFLHLDVTDSDEWATVVETIATEFGGLDLLWLNAGVMSRSRFESGVSSVIDTFRAPVYERVFAVNVGGMVRGIEAALPLLIARGGDLILTASASALVPYSLDPIYTASKMAVVALTRSLAPTLGDSGVRINCICPGSTDTPMVPSDRKRVVDGKVVSVSYGKEIQPAVRIAECAATILAGGSSGEVWASLPESAAFRVEFQDLFER